MTLHDIVYGLVGILMAYISWLLLRFLWLGLRRKKKSPVRPASDDIPTETLHGRIPDSAPDKVYAAIYADDSADRVAPVVPDERPEPRLSRPLPPDPAEFSFDALLEMRQMRTRFDELQRLYDALQQEIATLRGEIAELRAASQVSPIYGEAVTLARRGYDAQVIAEHCGISVAEAELVRSLSAEQQEGGDDEGN